MSKEKIWEFDCEIFFNGNIINQFTITDHFQINHSGIKIETIVNIVNKLNNEEIEPSNYIGNRNVFSWKVSYQDKKYCLIFWFKNGTDNHLWIRNCYRID